MGINIEDTRKDNFRKRTAYYKGTKDNDSRYKSYQLFNVALDILRYEFLKDKYKFESIDTLFGMPIVNVEKEGVKYTLLCDIFLNYVELYCCDNKVFFTPPKDILISNFISKATKQCRKPFLCEINLFDSMGKIKKPNSEKIYVKNTLTVYGRMFFTVEEKGIFNNDEVSII